MHKQASHWLIGTAARCLSSMATAETLTITVAAIADDAGHVLIELLNSQEAYEDSGSPVQQWSVSVSGNNEITVEAADIAPGTYGVRAMHHINDNVSMDTNLIGMPREAYGVSNNARGNFGPAKWKDIAFTLTGDTHIDIHLVDPR